jgi:hypothetical protein
MGLTLALVFFFGPKKGVGKTSLHTRFFRDEFSLPYVSTIGVEFGIKTIELCGQRIKLQGITPLSLSLFVGVCVCVCCACVCVECITRLFD